MQGIVIASHGALCEGMLDSLQMFFPDAEQIAACPLRMDADGDEYIRKLREAGASVDTGDGVIFFVDLKGGTPSNMIAQIMVSPEPMCQTEIITGMNFPMILETCAQRMFGSVDVAHILKSGRDGIEEMVFAAPEEEEDGEIE